MPKYCRQHRIDPADAAKGVAAERAFHAWLDGSVLPHMYIEQSPLTVAPIHPKEMPVVLTTEAEIETWMTALPVEALKLQRPLDDLSIVARGVKEDIAAG